MGAVEIEGLVFGDDFLKFQFDSLGILFRGEEGEFSYLLAEPTGVNVCSVGKRRRPNGH